MYATTENYIFFHSFLSVKLADVDKEKKSTITSSVIDLLLPLLL
jgi:hypothetical protein